MESRRTVAGISFAGIAGAFVAGLYTRGRLTPQVQISGVPAKHSEFRREARRARRAVGPRGTRPESFVRDLPCRIEQGLAEACDTGARAGALARAGEPLDGLRLHGSV